MLRTECHLPLPRLLPQAHALPVLYGDDPPVRTIARHLGEMLVFFPVTLNLMNVFQKWMGEFFARTTLFNLGAKYQLGHHVGESCELPSAAVDLTLFDIAGIKTVCVHYCYCGEPGKHQLPRVQLLRM